jgi:alanine-glyoxylate transaminase/serine-glyoxylate transaminase/serine-pyruvate transaminase
MQAEQSRSAAGTSDRTIPPLEPGVRLLCGPGPSNVHPDVLEALQRPMLSHLDPDFWDLLVDLSELMRRVFRADEDALSIALSASGTSGMEAGLAALTEPGETVIVAHAGFFGNRIREMAARLGCEVVDLSAPLGRIVPVEEILAAVTKHPDARLVAVVHAETSTGVSYPLEELSAGLRESGSDPLLYVDAVTSLGAQPFEHAAWGVDYAYSCSQKALGCPPGISPVALSPRALERIRERKTPTSFSFDFELLAKYWVDRPITYHHTMPILQDYALYEGLRLALEEGLEARWARHEDTGRHFQSAVAERGLSLLSDPDHTLAQLSAVNVPEGVVGDDVRRHLLRERGIEIGGGLGPGAPPIWRVGLMGTNATRETADRVLAGLDEALGA